MCCETVNRYLGKKVSRNISDYLSSYDVTMNEDYLRNRTGPGPENLAVMRRLALNLARLAVDKRTPSIRGRLKKGGWNHNYALKRTSLAGLLPENGAVQKR